MLSSVSAGTNLVDATKSCDDSIHAGNMLGKSWDGLKKFCFLHSFGSFWIRGGKWMRLEFFWQSFYSPQRFRNKGCVSFSSAASFRRKGSSKQYIPGKPLLYLLTQLHLMFIAVSALSKFRPRDSCGLRVASISFQLHLNMPSNSCCPLSDCPYNKPAFQERMLPWVGPREAGWTQGKSLIILSGSGAGLCL